MIKYVSAVVALSLLCPAAAARADTYPRQPGVDAVHYVFHLELLVSDSSEIRGEAAVDLRFVSDGVKEVFLDLASAATADVTDARDALAVMPTGSGKSLGYRLPAIVLPGTTVVVAPLIALMKHQVDDLDRRGIAASPPAPAGVGPVAPVASSRSEEGRAKNRRAEPVEL